jgi:flavin reductase (DIM6/NTAB) family NADH-FMN oxidoreductase RutF
MPPDPAQMKEVLSCFASGVTVVTTMHEGAPYGLTVSAFCAVSLSPARVLVCLGNDTDTKPLLERAGRFAVHILGEEHAGLGLRFAKVAADAGDPFTGLGFRSETTGAPVLSECLAWLDCLVESATPAGDHTIFVGAVEAAGLGVEGPPVLYYRRGWRVLHPAGLEP